MYLSTGLIDAAWTFTSTKPGKTSGSGAAVTKGAAMYGWPGGGVGTYSFKYTPFIVAGKAESRLTFGRGAVIGAGEACSWWAA